MKPGKTCKNKGKVWNHLLKKSIETAAVGLAVDESFIGASSRGRTTHVAK